MALAERAGLDARCQAEMLLGDWIDSPGGHIQGPERHLMAAVLFDGVITCLNYAGASGTQGRKRFQEAFGWVCNPGIEYVFSFENVCDCLGLDPAALRRGIMSACNSRAAQQRKKSRRTF